MNNNKVLAMLLGGCCTGAVLAAESSPLDGRWQLQNADTTQATIDAAIEDVVQDMNFFIRAIARSKLEKEATTCDRWLILTSQKRFFWQCDEQDPLEVATLAPTALKGDDGRDITATYKESANSVETLLASKRGERTNHWELISDNELHYTATIMSDRLPKPLSWTLTYQRVSD